MLASESSFHHEPVARSGRGKYRRRHPLRRAAGFQRRRQAPRQERSLRRGAPEYLKGRTSAGRARGSKAHDCVMLNARNNESDWDLVSGRKKVRVHVSGPVASRDFNSVSAFVYRGHGIGLVPSTYCDEAIARGRLVRVLPKWASPRFPVFALYSSRKFLPPRLGVFLRRWRPGRVRCGSGNRARPSHVVVDPKRVPRPESRTV